VTELSQFYQELIQGTGSTEPHSKEIKTRCWALVTKLLHVIFVEIHEVRMFATELATIKDDYAKVNGMFLYSVLEELCVLREFKSLDYRCHPSFNMIITMYLVETSLPRSEFEARKDGPGRDQLRVTALETKYDQLSTKVGVLVAANGGGGRNNRGGGGRGGAAAGAGIQQLE
jgi:hypothetical protein